MISKYFHRNITESVNYVCELESITTNNKTGPFLMKEYHLHNVKKVRLENGQQEFKIWYPSDGMRIILMWLKRLLLE
jgi:hypothetical protein